MTLCMYVHTLHCTYIWLNGRIYERKKRKKQSVRSFMHEIEGADTDLNDDHQVPKGSGREKEREREKRERRSGRKTRQRDRPALHCTFRNYLLPYCFPFEDRGTGSSPARGATYSTYGVECIGI